MAARCYYAVVDDLGILTVDEIEVYGYDETPYIAGARLATAYPSVIYFIVDNADPELRVPVSGNTT